MEIMMVTVKHWQLKKNKNKNPTHKKPKKTNSKPHNKTPQISKWTLPNWPLQIKNNKTQLPVTRKYVGLWAVPIQGLFCNNRIITVLQRFLCSYCSGFFSVCTGKSILNCINFFNPRGSDSACSYKCTKNRYPCTKTIEKKRQWPTPYPWAYTASMRSQKLSVHSSLNCRACQTFEDGI